METLASRQGRRFPDSSSITCHVIDIQRRIAWTRWSNNVVNAPAAAAAPVGDVLQQPYQQPHQQPQQPQQPQPPLQQVDIQALLQCERERRRYDTLLQRERTRHEREMGEEQNAHEREMEEERDAHHQEMEEERCLIQVQNSTITLMAALVVTGGVLRPP